MKAIALLVAISVSTAFSCLPERKDESKKIKEFLTEMADARMMDREEGRLAAERGTTQEIRDYGNYMVKDQTILLEALQKLAATKDVDLPKTISEKKAKL